MEKDKGFNKGSKQRKGREQRGSVNWGSKRYESNLVPNGVGKKKRKNTRFMEGGGLGGTRGFDDRREKAHRKRLKRP